MPGQIDSILSMLGGSPVTGQPPGAGAPYGRSVGPGQSFEAFILSLGIQPQDLTPELRAQLYAMWLEQKLRGQEERDALQPRRGGVQPGPGQGGPRR